MVRGGEIERERERERNLTTVTVYCSLRLDRTFTLHKKRWKSHSKSLIYRYFLSVGYRVPYRPAAAVFSIPFIENSMKNNEMHRKRRSKHYQTITATCSTWTTRRTPSIVIKDRHFCISYCGFYPFCEKKMESIDAQTYWTSANQWTRRKRWRPDSETQPTTSIAHKLGNISLVIRFDFSRNNRRRPSGWRRWLGPS